MRIALREISSPFLASALVLACVWEALSAERTGQVEVPGLGRGCNYSKQCILHQDPPLTGKYVCLPPENECESRYLERGCTREACETASECTFFPGECFCPGGMQCICGGGPPPACEPTDR